MPVPVFKTRDYDAAIQFSTTEESKNLLWVSEQRHSSGSRTYMFWVFEEFCSYYQYSLKPYQRRHHEMIRPELPCKLYFDMERDGHMYTVEETHFILERLSQAVSETLAECRETAFHQVNVPRVLFANRKDHKSDREEPKLRFSMHVMYSDVWFENSMDLRQFVMIVRARLPNEYQELMDVQVYSDLAIKQFRMGYSNKMERGFEDICCYPLTSNPDLMQRGQTNELFDIHIFLESLLTVRKANCTESEYSGFLPPDSPDGFCPPPKDELIEQYGLDVVKGVQRPEPVNPGASVDYTKEIARIKDWLMTVKRVARFDHHRDTPTGQTYLLHPSKDKDDLKSLCCPVIGRPHKSNGIYLILTMYGKGYIEGEFHCFDCNYNWSPEIPFKVLCYPELYQMNEDQHREHDKEMMKMREMYLALPN